MTFSVSIQPAAGRACSRGLRPARADDGALRDARGAGWHFGQKTLLRPPTLSRRMTV
jgi:hypothetical protein